MVLAHPSMLRGLLLPLSLHPPVTIDSLQNISLSFTFQNDTADSPYISMKDYSVI